MTAGESLLINIVLEKDTKSLATLDSDWLDGDEVAIYNYVIGHFRDYGKLPSYRLVSSTFALTEKPEDSSAFYLDALLTRHIYTTLADKFPRLIKDSKSDSHSSLEKMASIILSLRSSGKDSDLIEYGKDGASRLKEYEERIKSGGLKYLSTGDTFLDSLLFGYGKTDLITIGGRPGTKKTWILIYLILALDKILPKFITEDRPLLFVSNEIGDSELKDRMDCMRYKLCYTDFLKGDLDTHAQERYESGLLSKRKSKSHIKITTKCRKLADLEMLIKLYNPAMIFLDGSYLMEPQMSTGWEKVTFITQNLKALSLSNGIPIINTTQSSRRRNKVGSVPKSAIDAQDDFAFADSYSQDSDVAMLLYPDAKTSWTNIVNGIIAKGRSIDIEKSNFCVNTSLTTMDFSFAEVLEPSDEDYDETTVY